MPFNCMHCTARVATAFRGLFCAMLSGIISVMLSAVFTHNSFAQTTNKQSSFELMSPATQAIQLDDAQNPAMLWVKAGERAWASCTQCHGKAQESMRGVAAKFPRLVDQSLLDLRQQINRCRVKRLGLAALGSSSEAMLQMTAFIGLQSKGLAITPSTDRLTEAAAKRGEIIFNQRMGQLDLSCAQCHDARSGLRLGASVIVQGHPTGYPQYRFEWQTLGSLARRMRGCMVGVRAAPFEADALEWLDLEAFLMRRAAGMIFETPAVRP